MILHKLSSDHYDFLSCELTRGRPIIHRKNYSQSDKQKKSYRCLKSENFSAKMCYVCLTTLSFLSTLSVLSVQD